MARAENGKHKLIRLLQILNDRTDEDKGLTMNEIIAALSEYGIKAERKSIYDDLLTLEELGFATEKLPTRPPEYTLAERIFELPELKLLVDAVGASKFITAEYSSKIIDKLKSFAGAHRRGELSRQVYVEGRAKTMNKATIYTIDTIHEAINKGRQITFKYFDFDRAKRRILRHGGELYRVSPIALIWNSENYYLVAFDEKSGARRNYRVDKMLELSLTEEPRSAEATLESFNSADYTQKIFGMYGGREELVSLECAESLAGVMIDRFGTDPTFHKTENGFRFSARVMVSPNFFAWVMSFGSQVKILSPEWVRDKYLEELRATLDIYKN